MSCLRKCRLRSRGTEMLEQIAQHDLAMPIQVLEEEAVRQDGSALVHASPSLRSDLLVVLEAVLQMKGAGFHLMARLLLEDHAPEASSNDMIQRALNL